MASDSGARAVNGNYGSMHSYGSADQQPSSHEHGSGVGGPVSRFGGAEAPHAQNPSTGTSAAAAEGSSSVPKDEVGWYFVEQYYTTLSKNPEKLHVSPSPGRALPLTISSPCSSSSTTNALSSFRELKPRKCRYL